MQICGSALMRTLLPVHYLTNRVCAPSLLSVTICDALPRLCRAQDETKLVVLPEDARKAECTVLTAGIGNDIGSEMRLKQLMPQCTFVGKRL